MNTPHHPGIEPNPIAWLWQELERRFGSEVVQELRAEYLRRWRERNRYIRYGAAQQEARSS